MDMLRSTFDRAGEIYDRLFGNWLHVHFFIRMGVLLLATTVALVILWQLLKRVIVPGLLMFYYHVIFRAWNFIAVESPSELIYIKFYGKGKDTFSGLYHRLTRRADINRTKLDHAKYRGMVYRGRRYVLGFMLVIGVGGLLLATSFGIYHQSTSTLPAMAVVETTTAPPEVPTVPTQAVTPMEEVAPQWLDATVWEPDTNIVLELTPEGQEGTPLRSGPGIDAYHIIEMLWANDRLVYLHTYHPAEADGYWLRVLSPRGTEGYVSSQLVVGFTVR